MLWAARVMRQHMATYGSTREDFGRIAVNNRTNAGRNPQAVFRKAITIEDYLGSPAIDDPMHLLDMDAPIDGALAAVLTTVERARDLPHRPVLIDRSGSALPYRSSSWPWRRRWRPE
jgi:acetyl-CoA acetyltransferase